MERTIVILACLGCCIIGLANGYVGVLKEENSILWGSKMGGGDLSAKALLCICEVESHCNASIGCRKDPVTLSCGPYQIKELYWQDCGMPGPDYKSCASSKECSETCVHAYMRRYGHKCTAPRTPNDEDYARIHNGGPKGCQRNATLGYWARVKKCCDAGPGKCNY